MGRWGLTAGMVCALSIGCGSPEQNPAADGGCETDCASTQGATSGAADDGDSTPDDDGASDDGTSGGGSADGIPCAVRDVLADNCWGCHGSAPKFGAPMSLSTYDDFQIPIPSDPATPTHAQVGVRVTDEAAPMPADGSLSEDDRGVLVNWVAAGAPMSDETCDSPDPDPDPDPGVGPDALPCEVTHSFTAHAASGPTDPFEVPVVDNLYQCYTFASPLTEPTQISAWAPIIDDERVLHHWILYKTSEPQVDGGAGPCNMPGDAAFLAGWAPGGKNFILPEDVGLEFGGPDDYYILQMHYNNSGGHTDAADNSGVAMCATPPKEEAAGVIWLGTYNIDIPADADDHVVIGRCPSLATSVLPEPLNIIASFPHMHELGRAMTTDIFRGGPNGPQETLVDATPFAFSNQVMYPHDPAIPLNPGDEVVTRCTYENTTGQPVGFGENTEDEMCFNFVVAYPIQDIPAEARQCTL